MKKPKRRSIKTVGTGVKIGTSNITRTGFLTPEEWIAFKIWCMENKIQVYKQVAYLVKRFVDKIRTEKK
ncbi:MAG: hypothetical protein ACE5WD_12430 [Candidatus Aminicenantia bacterium]